MNQASLLQLWCDICQNITETRDAFRLGNRSPLRSLNLAFADSVKITNGLLDRIILFPWRSIISHRSFDFDHYNRGQRQFRSLRNKNRIVIYVQRAKVRFLGVLAPGDGHGTQGLVGGQVDVKSETLVDEPQVATIK